MSMSWNKSSNHNNMHGATIKIHNTRCVLTCESLLLICTPKADHSFRGVIPGVRVRVIVCDLHTSTI